MNKKILTMTLIFLLIAVMAVPSLAWFIQSVDISGDPNDMTGATEAAYFERGNGSKDNPYVISNAMHMYNFAWLQNLGQFTEKTYFKLGADIDMAGALSGSTTTSGAIPPIGSKEEPFIGEFDGNGKVIKNLWVSTDKSDWKDMPSNPDNYTSQYAGLFGAIGDTAVVQNFILDRIEVTTHIEDSVVGLICGYVDAKLDGVRVFNGIMTAKAGLAKVSTRYSLIGDVSPDVIWEGMPTIDTSIGQGTVGGATGGKGGDLVVNPSAPSEPEVTEVEENGYLMVPDSIEGTAYYTGPINFTGFTKKDTLRDGANSYAVLNANTITDAAKKARVEDALNIYDNVKKMMIMTALPFSSNATAGAAPSATVTAPVLGKDGTLTNMEIPANGLWFKPQSAGIAALAFGVTNMPNDRYMMVYRLERDDDNKLQLVSKTTAYAFKKNTGTKLKNGSGVYYELEVTQADIDAGYEFFIGWSCDHGTGDSTCGFFYFRLAGTNATLGSGSGGNLGEDGTATKKIVDVDFITKDEVNNLTRETIHQSLLRFYYNSTALTANTSVYYTAITDTAATTGSTVHYYWKPTSVAIPMVEFAAGKESEKGVVGDFYIRWQESGDKYQVLTE